MLARRHSKTRRALDLRCAGATTGTFLSAVATIHPRSVELALCPGGDQGRTRRAHSAPGDRPDRAAELQLGPIGVHGIMTHANDRELHFDPVSVQRARDIVIDRVSIVQAERLSLTFPGAE